MIIYKNKNHLTILNKETLFNYLIY